MTNRSQVAYTQYIKVTLDRIREYKEQGHDVSEANRILQSIVAAVMDGDYNCADFLINELESVFKKMEFYPIPSGKEPAEKVDLRERILMPLASDKIAEEPFRLVVRELKKMPDDNQVSRFIMVFLYVFLFLFLFTLGTIIYYLLRFQGSL